MIVNSWPGWFRNLYGGDFPRDYVCFDIETTGYLEDEDVITQIAHVLVRDGKIADQLELVLNWTNHKIVADHWLRPRMLAMRAGMEGQGKRCQISYETLLQGIDPFEALTFYNDLFATLRAQGTVLVGHNVYGFDEGMIRANLVGFGLAKEFTLGDRVLDTEGIAKASQIMFNPKVHPRQGDTLRTYFTRVHNTRVAGVRSNLDNYCFQKYRLAERGMDPAKMHGALADSTAVHLLMEAFREELGAAPVPPSQAADIPTRGVPAAPTRPPTVLEQQLRRRGQRRI